MSTQDFLDTLNKKKAEFETFANKDYFSEEEFAHLGKMHEEITNIEQYLRRNQVAAWIKEHGMKMPEKLRKHFPDNGDGGAGNNDEPAAKRGKSGH
jgi:hypothetical protein